MGSDNKLYLDGEWTAAKSGETFTVRNPANPSEIIATYQEGAREDAARAVDIAQEAQSAWGNTPGPERGDVLRRTAELLSERKEETTKLLTQEEGKTLSEAAPEVQRAIDIFHYYAQKARDLGGVVKSSSSRNSDLSTRREPLGVAALITPWNYPIAIAAWKLAPALAAGNTVVLKPASQAPGVARIIIDCLNEAGLPDGVANFVTGPGSVVGDELITNVGVDVVSFTGSSTIGQQVYQSATEGGKRIQCEMGGKNPTIVMPSADVEQAVGIVGAGAFGVTGQACTACSRAIVHNAIFEEFRDSIIDYAEELEVGPGLDDPDMGPQVSQSEFDGTTEYIDIAENEGAILETGGETYERSGFFVEPTVFTADHSMRIAQEEVFGPVLSLIRVDSFEDAISIANDVDYGLSASIVTNDLIEANRFVDEVEAGVVKVNEKTTGLELHVPFGGYKESSTNTYREQGDAGIDFFTSTKTVYTNY